MVSQVVLAACCYRKVVDPFTLEAPAPFRVPAARANMEKTASKRVVLRITPTTVVSWDHSKLGGKY